MNEENTEEDFIPIDTTIVKGDLSRKQRDEILEGIKNKAFGLDLETGGLDYNTTDIKLATLIDYTSNKVFIIRTHKNKKPPANLIEILKQDVNIVYHHVMFDNRFIYKHWGIVPTEEGHTDMARLFSPVRTKLACTKIIAKIIDPNRSSYSLKDLVKDYLEVDISKDYGEGSWDDDELSDQQIQYCIDDVAYLSELLQAMMKDSTLEQQQKIMRYNWLVPAEVRRQVDNEPHPLEY